MHNKNCFGLTAIFAAAICSAAPLIHNGKTFDESAGDKNVQIKADMNGSRIINCTFKNYKTVGAVVAIKGADDVIIDSCTFINSPGDTKDRDIHAINIGASGSNVVVRNCLFQDIGADGFQCGHSGNEITNIVIENNIFKITKANTGENGVDIKQCKGPVAIKNNHFEGFRPCHKTDQIGCTGSSGPGIVLHNFSKNVTIDGNTFYNNVTGISITKGTGSIDGALIINNIFYDNLERGIVAWDGANIKIYNNTFVNNKTDNLKLGGGLAGADNRNNLFVGAGGSSSDYSGQGNLHIEKIEDAGFADAAKNNYHLTKSSPAVDAGVNVSAVAKDIDGDSRPQDGTYDCGADEFKEGTTMASTKMRLRIPAIMPSDDTHTRFDIRGRKAFAGSKNTSSGIILIMDTRQARLKL